MRYTLSNITKKHIDSLNNDVIDCTVMDLDGNEFQASIWKVQKDKSFFPNFDNLAEGSQVEGNAWQSPSNQKWSIFPPRPTKNGKFTPNKGNIQAVMKQKQESIEHSQEKKDLGIRLSSSARMANEIVITFYKDLTEAEIKTKWLNWREWFLDNWETTEAPKVAGGDYPQEDFGNSPF